MNLLFFWTQVLFFLCFSKQILAPPPNRNVGNKNNINENDNSEQNEANKEQNIDLIKLLSYNKYLEIIVKILEEQPKFQENLKKLNQSDIKAGKIADYIDDLDEDVFKKLTEEKLKELKRLENLNIKAEHLDLSNLLTFGKEDLRKLIVSTIKDIEEINNKREKQFKEYELKKQAEEDHRLAQMTEEERNKVLKEKRERLKAMENVKLNHPGGREQFEEVWDKTDHLNKNEFDPKTFFALHDIDSNGYWSSDEINALFQLELDKLYNETDSNFDINERNEEMNKALKHIIDQMDENKDGLISYDEYLKDFEAQNKNVVKNEYKDLRHEKVFTDEELKEFEEQYGRNKGWTDDYIKIHPQTTTASLSITNENNSQNQAINNISNQKPIEPIVGNNYPSSQSNTFNSENVHKDKEKKIDSINDI